MPIPHPERWALLSPLLDELLDLPEAARAQRLAGLHADDPDLANELSALLASGQQAQSDGFLRQAVGPAAGPADTGASLAGQRLGAYLLEAPLGQGGGGSVWRARREDGRFDGAVAIKLLHLSLMGQAGAERFRREGHILARLKHAHIASLLDAGITPGGQPYLVIELVQGERIDRHCDAQRLSVEARLALFNDVLAAVAHAHTHGVIHRDLKPGNILVSAEGTVKLLDFGIAKLLDDETTPAEATELTREGGRVLTPEYAAPEQLRGEGVTTATDVYALGVLLYQLLVGRHPTAPAAGTAADVARATLDTEPARLSRGLTLTDAQAADLRDSTPQQLQRTLAGDLDTIVAHALRKAPAERYATVAAFAEDLRRYRMHEPVIAQPDSAAYRTRKFVRRHRGGVVAGAMIFLAILAGLAGTVWQGQRAMAAAEQATAERDRARTELNHAQAAQELLSFLLSDGSGKALTTSELLDRTQAAVERGFAKLPLERARLLLMLGSQRGELSQVDQGRAALERARSAAVEAGQPVLSASIDCMLGHMHTLQGEFAPARQQIDAAIQRLSPSGAEAATAKTDCLNARVLLLETTGESPAQAEADAREALRLYAAAGIQQSAQSIQLRAALASALRMQGRRAEAVQQFRTALAELNALGRGQTARAATLWNNLGAALGASGQVQAAVEALRTSVAINTAVTGSDHDPVTLANLGLNLAQQGQMDEALAMLRKAWAQASADHNPRVQGEVGMRLASAAISAGRADEAAAPLAQAQKLLSQLLPPDHPSLAMCTLQAARLALLRGQPAQAPALLATAQQALDRAAADHPGRVLVRMERARAAQALVDPVAALGFAEQALAQAQHFSEGFATSEPLGSVHLLLAELAATKGLMPLAIQHGEEALRHHRASLGEASAVVAKTQVLVERWRGAR